MVSWIPGWSSIAGTAWWSGFYFWVSICALIALGMAEVASHRYSDRKDELVAIEQEAIQRRHDVDMAHVQHDTAEAVERAAQLEKDAAVARAAIADANARAAEATQKAAEAQLALGKFKAPRTLSLEQQARIAAKLEPFAGTIYDAGIGPAGDPEPLYLLRSIHSALSQAGWVQIAWTGQDAQTYTEPPMPAVGLTMVTNVIVDVNPNWWAKYGAAAKALADALAAEDIAAIPDSQPTSINSDAIHVRIGRKL